MPHAAGRHIVKAPHVSPREQAHVGWVAKVLLLLTEHITYSAWCRSIRCVAGGAAL